MFLDSLDYSNIMGVAVDMLMTVPLFAGTEERELKRMADIFRREQVEKGDELFHQRQPADRFYVVLRGTVAVKFKPDDGEPLTIAVIEPDGVCGWSAVLGRDCYSSTAICNQDCQLLSANGTEFRDVIETFDDSGAAMLTRFSDLIGRRYDTTRQQILDLVMDGVSHD